MAPSVEKNRNAILTVITARGGSKGLPGKNIKPFLGKPLIAYSIEAAKQARYDNADIVVSTDDQEIAEVAKQYGASVPFMRPDELATDSATSIDVLKHVITEMECSKNQGAYDWVLLLQPTSPLRTSHDIEQVFKLSTSRPCDAVISVVEASGSHPLKIKKIDSGYLKPYLDKERNVATRRQDLSPVFNTNGAIYLVKRDAIMNENLIFTDKTLAYEMPRERSIDIDDLFDFEVAELLLQKRLQGAS